MIAFVDEHRATLGVEPIRRLLQFAPSPSGAHVAQRREPTPGSARRRRDAALGVEIRRVLQANLEVCGAGKIWRQLCRGGIEVARYTVERLMRWLGIESRHPRQGSQDHDQR